MPRYVLGLVVGFLLMVGLWCGLFFASFGRFATFADRQLGAWVAIKQRAVEAKLSAPKVVFAGGSNVLFGIQAAEVERRLGVPCVNYGIYAGLPFGYLATMWKRILRPGDLLVLSFEWRFLMRKKDETPNDIFIGYMLGGDPAYFWNLDFNGQLAALWNASPARLLAPITRSAAGERRAQMAVEKKIFTEGIDAHGDSIGNTRPEPFTPVITKILQAPRSNVVDSPNLARARGDTPFWKGLRDFLDWCRRHDIEVVFVAPSILARPEFSSPEYRRFFEAAEAHYRQLGVPVLSPQRDNLYPPDRMFNTVYHLNARGAAERTKKLIPLLAPVVKQRFSPP